jgi:hypothetical protein
MSHNSISSQGVPTSFEQWAQAERQILRFVVGFDLQAQEGCFSMEDLVDRQKLYLGHWIQQEEFGGQKSKMMKQLNPCWYRIHLGLHPGLCYQCHCSMRWTAWANLHRTRGARPLSWLELQGMNNQRTRHWLKHSETGEGAETSKLCSADPDQYGVVAELELGLLINE